MVSGVVYSERYLEHHPSPGHPESPERLRSMVEALESEGLWNASGTAIIEPSAAALEDIELVHERAYVERVERLSSSERMLDLDTPTDRKTFDIAKLAAGGAIVAGEKVVEGDFDNAFALVRPPGHHAKSNDGGGFCYFNNVAIMTEKLKREGRIERAMIFDFDAHHGNGTQEIFYDDGDILYMSLHQDGRTLYPGTGFSDEIGAGDGEGFNVNVPFPPGSSDEEYASALEEIFNPLARAFEPDLIAVSIGMDVHERDPLTQLRLSSAAYGWISEAVIDRANELCDGRVVFSLEGGYAVGVVGEIAVKVVKALLGEGMPGPPEGSSPPVVRGVKEKLRDYWEIFA